MHHPNQEDKEEEDKKEEEEEDSRSNDDGVLEVALGQQSFHPSRTLVLVLESFGRDVLRNGPPYSTAWTTRYK